ncbi:MAG: thiol:disulfide interchange protein DsbA/DsbL [Betaproteobacteria bacterium]|jgi:thiol:disulfide interchange protein DsbA|nr:thiol:disulfide interchange protein DsbA/DsbL [Betaproteobacteria bacterium]MBK7079688.1 thiol:disulfide interchange protein DsbA/DsbL [Betaproteobacteria bacterium]MBK9677025.1 thiol:disulfide interchange protein DsbA/DsbL [Betaproteobacteria bacterium]MBK9704601.1 thiol:disulfide interchange protein DsbA/DsbL [Betaproteobacteria bacterium]
MSSVRRIYRLLVPLALSLVAALPLAAAAQAPALQEGTHYQRLKTPQPVDSGDKIEVLEFFSYGCPHCADLDPVLVGWQKALPADVQFRRVPVGFGREAWDNLGKAYYTLEALGVEARLTPEMFTAIHRGQTNLASPKTFFDWAAGKGLERKKVEDMFNSFAIAGKMNKANQVAKAYSVQGVPLVIVDGKFSTASDKVGAHANMPSAINALIAKAKTERSKK